VHGRRYAYGGISCVPFARNASGIDVAGNAWEWWDNAAGVYARGTAPEAGSVLAFRANGRMRLGHVAVVSRVINPREIEVDQANWWGAGMRGGVARGTPVVDVSEANDWSAVRVGLGESGDFGSVYPTYGFIYDRPDNGVMVAAKTAPAPQPELNPAPADLRPAAERGWETYEEVAEAPATPRRHRHATHVAAHHGHARQVASLDPRRL
jgi:surface antigen